MSEYIEIETELNEDDPHQIIFYTNLPLTAVSTAVEEYDSYDTMQTASPLVQAIAMIEGLAQIQLAGSEMVVTRTADTPEHQLIAEITAVLKEFFL